MEINVSKDTPLSEIKDDAFHREPIVNTVVKVINNLCTQNENCFNIGIFGKWGEGKTTVLNFIKQKLLSQEDNIIIAEFNPWFFKDDESLYLDFFRTISNQSPDKKLAGVIKKYASIVSLGLSGLSKIAALSMHPIVGGIIKMFNKCVNAFSKVDNSKSVLELKKDIDTAIDKSKKHYVIFIDDLDRLDKQELHSVLNLIKHTANFHNTIYIVAMDKDMVARSLNTEYDEEDNKNSGYDFLEKIFQLQIELPKIPSYRLYNSLMKRITPLFERCSLRDDNIEAIKTDCRQVVGPVLDSAREIVLISNILWAYLPLVYKNVDVTDFCILQALKVLFPAMYQMIRNNKKRLICDNIVVKPNKTFIYRESFYEELKKDANYNSRYDSFIKRLLGFPPFNLRQTRKSLCTEFFDRYFVYEISEKSPKEEEVLQLSQSIDKGITSIFATMNEIYSNYGDIGLQIAIQLIVDESTPLQHSQEVLKRLCCSIAMFNKTHHSNDVVWDKLSVRWDMEIVRLLNMMKIGGIRSKEVMASLREIYAIANPCFCISIFLCYYDYGEFGKFDVFESLVADYLNFLLKNDDRNLFDMEGRAIKLFYPFFKKYHQDGYRKMILKLRDFNSPFHLLSIMSLYFGTKQTEEELDRSYGAFEKLFYVNEIDAFCKDPRVRFYIYNHDEMKLCADQFNTLYEKHNAGSYQLRKH